MSTKLPNQNNRSEAELMRCISRLSFIGMGLSKDLDILLSKLRTTIKSDCSTEDIKILIDQISQLLLTLEDKSDSSKVEVVSNEINLFERLLAQNLPSKLKVELKKAMHKEHELSAIDIADSIVSAIQNYLNTVESVQQDIKKEPQKKGFLSKLFSRSGQTPQELPANSISEVSSSQLVPEDLKNSLLQLVEQLSVMDTYSEIATKLTEKVIELDSVWQLSEILELITGAFVEVAGYEHQQFESFLKSLSKRIDRVNEFISNTVEYSTQIKKESNQLDLELQDSVFSIKTSVENSSSLNEVKSNIYQQMDSIVLRMNEFCQFQESSHQQLTQSIENLQEQLKATEDESSRLRDDLAEQKVRAQTDPLTRLPNRYSYNERLTQEYNRWRRYRNALSLVVGDIDFFKNINDEYGHDAGDKVLRDVAQYLQDQLRESDFIARFGGEEFIILLPETTLIDATKAINKLRLGIKEFPIEFEGHSINIAISFGISSFEGDDTPKVVFSRADKALYRAKEKGRDQVCCQRANVSE